VVGVLLKKKTAALEKRNLTCENTDLLNGPAQGPETGQMDGHRLLNFGK